MKYFYKPHHISVNMVVNTELAKSLMTRYANHYMAVLADEHIEDIYFLGLAIGAQKEAEHMIQMIKDHGAILLWENKGHV